MPAVRRPEVAKEPAALTVAASLASILARENLRRSFFRPLRRVATSCSTRVEAALEWLQRVMPAAKNGARSADHASRPGAEPLAGIPGCQDCRAVRLHTGRSLHTASILLLSDRGDAMAMVRIALAAGGDEHVEVEGTWLKRLESFDRLQGQVPRLLSEGFALNGRRYLMTDTAPAGRSTQLLLPAHIRFLATLAGASIRHSSFTSSPCFHSLEWNLAQLEHVLDPLALALLKAAVRDCWLSLSRWAGPFVISQGDFSPGNIALHRRAILVSSWMHARTGANPLADVFHYLLAPRALARRGLNRKLLTRALQRGAEAAREIHPGYWWDERVVSALALAYLLEKLLAGARADRALDLANPLTSAYLGLVERRAQWLSS